MSFDAKAFLRTLTEEPGVYRMIGEGDAVLYVGKTVMAYRDYVDANGTVIKTETLHKDTYQARNTSYKCTPYVEPEVPEEPEPTDPDYPDYPDNPDEPTDPTEPDDPMNPWD